LLAIEAKERTDKFVATREPDIVAFDATDNLLVKVIPAIEAFEDNPTVFPVIAV
jgi:hypothetical protein